MKLRKNSVLIILLALMLLLSACSADVPQADAGRLQVVTTIFPYYDFLTAIGGEYIEVHLLITPGADSHSFEPTPQDVLALAAADLFVLTGGPSDAWAMQLLAALDTQPQTLELWHSVELLAEEHSEHDGHDHHHDHDHGHEAVEWDEHIWTSPKNARLIVAELAAALAELDELHAADYAARAAAYTEQLDELDAAFTQLIGDAPREELIFADRFPFRYFTTHYGLHAHAAFPGCNDKTEPSAAVVAELLDEVAAEAVPLVLYGEYSNGNIARVICEETGCGMAVFHSCHNLTRDEAAAGATYLSIMWQNYDVLTEALY